MDLTQDLLPLATTIAPGDVVTGIVGGVSKNIPLSLISSLLNKQTGTTYTLALTDGSGVVEMNNASANSVTVPPSSSVNFPLGTQIAVYQYGAGLTTILAGSGVTVRNAGALAGQYSFGYLIKRGADEWIFSAGGVATGGGGGGGDTTPPTVSSRQTASTTTIQVTLSEAVTSTLAGWSFKKNGSAYTPSSISGSGTTILTFTFGTSMVGTDVLLCSYNSGTGDCKDLALNPLASFTDQSVTNTLSSASNILLAANHGYTNASQVFTYTPGGSSWGNTGVDDKYLPASTDGGIYMKYTASDAQDAFIGFVTKNLGIKFANMQACFRFTAGVIESRESGTTVTHGSATIGTWYGIFRVGSAFKIRQSTDEITWTDVATSPTLSYSSTAAHYIASDINGAGKMYNPKGVSIVAIPTVSGATGIDCLFGTTTGITNTSQVLTPTTNDAAYGHKGLDAKSLAVSTTGRIFEKWTGGLDSFFGFSTSNSNAGLAGIFAGFLISSTDKSIYKTESGSSASVNGDAGLNYYYSVYRDGSTGAMKIGRSADGLNWMDTGVVYTNNSTAQLFILCDLFGATTAKLDHPQGNSIA